MNAEYFYVIEKVRHGPVTFNALRKLATDGVLRRNHKIWTKGMEKWEPASTLPDLFEDLPPDFPEIEESLVDEPLDTKETPPPLEPDVTQPVPKPNWMGLWSFILPGVGQVICGQTVKGALMIVASIALNLFFGGFLSIITCPIGSLDAILVAKKRAQGIVEPWEFFPEPASLTQKQVVIVVGIACALLFLNVVGAFSEQEKLYDEWRHNVTGSGY